MCIRWDWWKVARRGVCFSLRTVSRTRDKNRHGWMIQTPAQSQLWKRVTRWHKWLQFLNQFQSLLETEPGKRFPDVELLAITIETPVIVWSKRGRWCVLTGKQTGSQRQPNDYCDALFRTLIEKSESWCLAKDVEDDLERSEPRLLQTL